MYSPNTPVDSSDIRANGPEYIDHAAKYLRRSPQRIKVFEAVYKKQGHTRSVDYLVEAAKMPRVRVLQEADKLAAYGLIVKNKNQGKKGLSYSKMPFYAKNYTRILDYARTRGN